TSGNSTTTSKNGYTIKLTNIYSNSQKDAAGNPIDILETYLNDAESTGTDATSKAELRTAALASIFGHVNAEGKSDGKQTDSFKLNAPTFNLQGDSIAYNYGGKTYTAKLDDVVKAANDKTPTVTFSNTDEAGKTSTVSPNLVDMFKGLGTSQTDYNKNGITPTYTFDKASMMLKATYGAVNYNVMFNSSDGTFASVGAAQNSEAVEVDGQTVRGQTSGGGDGVTLHMGVLGANFSDINIDFTQMKNFNNGGSSTVGMDTGTVEDKSYGAGKKLGAMTGVSVQQDGKIFGSYDNGNTVLLGQIAVAQFANASGLEELGNNCYGTTLNSGTFDGIGVEVTADGGSMNTGQLEMSNVDLSTEFTEMITTQRGFQANSRIITVSDTLLEELTNLKR
ncbi:MAG: flagellar hook-basal body complex protein, partial [Lachnospiraceae bacterium]|nr:flagellar hook-basal body complex protein [Lachnospiraceae bacterium]